MDVSQVTAGIRESLAELAAWQQPRWLGDGNGAQTRVAHTRHQDSKVPGAQCDQRHESPGRSVRGGRRAGYPVRARTSRATASSAAFGSPHGRTPRIAGAPARPRTLLPNCSPSATSESVP